MGSPTADVEQAVGGYGDAVPRLREDNIDDGLFSRLDATGRDDREENEKAEEAPEGDVSA
jgi:hypothetical protein